MFDLEIADLAKPGVTFQIGIEPNRIDILTEVESLSGTPLDSGQRCF